MKNWKIWLFLIIWLALGVGVNVINNIGAHHGEGEGETHGAVQTVAQEFC